MTAPIINSLNVATTVAIMNFDVTNTSAGQKLFIQASPSVSAGITNISSKIALIAVEPQTSGLVDIWASYIAVFGTPIVGQKIFLRVSGVNETTGQMTVPEILSYIVTA